MRVMAPMATTCAEGKRLMVEAVRAAEELYRLLNMQLGQVVRGEPNVFLETQIQRATRKLLSAKSVLNTHLARHGCGIDPTSGLCDYSLE